MFPNSGKSKLGRFLTQSKLNIVNTNNYNNLKYKYTVSSLKFLMDRLCIPVSFPNEQNVINLVQGKRKEDTGIKTQWVKVCKSLVLTA
jgi:hypothetical protein